MKSVNLEDFVRKTPLGPIWYTADYRTEATPQEWLAFLEPLQHPKRTKILLKPTISPLTNARLSLATTFALWEPE